MCVCVCVLGSFSSVPFLRMYVCIQVYTCMCASVCPARRRQTWPLREREREREREMYVYMYNTLSFLISVLPPSPRLSVVFSPLRAVARRCGVVSDASRNFVCKGSSRGKFKGEKRDDSFPPPLSSLSLSLFMHINTFTSTSGTGCW